MFHFISLVCIHFKFASLQDFISLSLHFPSSHLFILSFTSFHVIKFASLHFTLFYFISNLFHFIAFHFSLPLVLLYWATSKLSVYWRAIQPYIHYQFATPFQSMVPVAVTWRFVASKITAGRADRTSPRCGRETGGSDAWKSRGGFCSTSGESMTYSVREGCICNVVGSFGVYFAPWSQAHISTLLWPWWTDTFMFLPCFSPCFFQFKGGFPKTIMLAFLENNFTKFIHVTITNIFGQFFLPKNLMYFCIHPCLSEG